MKSPTYFLLIVSLLFSCSKTDFSEQRNIAEWTKDISPDIKQRYELRLAFGKTLAAAMCEEELRQYIKEKSIIPNENIYGELVFGIIKDDFLPSGRTVAQVIKQYEDAEVKELFGEGLQDVLYQEDPMIAIKIPDIFHQIDWDIKNVVPFVGIETPSPINLSKYAFFYYNGYHELIPGFNGYGFKNVKYFHLVLKYSNDHVLININDLVNEKGISLFEFLPQIEYCQQNILNNILASGIRNPNTPNKVILNKRICYNIWKNKCGYSGEFGFKQDTCGTPFPCSRDCYPDSPYNKNLVLHGFDIVNSTSLTSFGVFDESADLNFLFYEYNNENVTYRRFVFPVFRFIESNIFTTKIEVKNSKTSYEGSNFEVPLVNLDFKTTENQRKWFDIKALIYDNVAKEKEYRMCFAFLQYKDIVDPAKIGNSPLCWDQFYMGSDFINASVYSSTDDVNHGWCTPGDTLSHNISVLLRY